ncbi:MAG: glycosyltransferase family 4 protein [Blautia sp.]|uniref:glycosyltransferase family 4 protein n=1 Tax=Blautia sp. TaxID=1955243 RepID=UPI002E77F24A|nr:glycosyltransferase family 4 protein [Blautia sp.]MEE0040551.1 glycosyltransferase family 4 protein [Blautia sp.]
MKTIVIFIGGYLPGKKYGGPVTSLENFTNQLHDNYDIRIICSDHDFKENDRYKGITDGWNQVGFAKVFYTNERDYNEEKFHEIIKDFSNDIVMFYLSGIYYIKMNYAAIRLARKLSIPVLLAPRGDLMKNSITMKSKAKMIKKLTFLMFCKCTNLFKDIYFQSTSDEETDGLHKYLAISDNQIFQMPNMPVMKHERTNHIKKEDEIRIVFISRLMVKKNPLLALKAVQNIDDKYKVQFDLFGPKEDEEYWQECSTLIDTINSTKKNIEVTYKGALDPQAAKRVYDTYDCFLFPTRSENYGHVIVEALFSGCPVVLSKGTTPFDDCSNRGGYIADLSRITEFTKHLENIAKMNQEEYQGLALKLQEYVDEKFQVEKLKSDYIDMIEKISGELR